MKKKAFEFVIIRHIRNECGDIVDTEFVNNEGTYLLASDKEKAMTLASREIPEELIGYIDDIEILIRPF